VRQVGYLPERMTVFFGSRSIIYVWSYCLKGDTFVTPLQHSDAHMAASHC